MMGHQILSTLFLLFSFLYLFTLYCLEGLYTFQQGFSLLLVIPLDIQMLYNLAKRVLGGLIFLS